MNDLRFIALSGKRGEGKFAIVDEADFERVTSRFSWNLNCKGYAAAGCYDGKSRRKTIFLHHEVFGDFVWSDTCEVDHASRVKLDCRRINLRIATAAQNAANRSRKTSALKGVYVTPYGRFVAYIGSGANRNQKHLGVFSTKEAAARVYDLAALKRWGEFAQTNFPRSDYEVKP